MPAQQSFTYTQMDLAENQSSCQNQTLLSARPSTNSHPPFCATCLSFLQCPSKLITADTWVGYEWSDVVAAASTGCRNCTSLLERLTKMEAHNLPVQFALSIHTSQHTERPFIWAINFRFRRAHGIANWKSLLELLPSVSRDQARISWHEEAPLLEVATSVPNYSGDATCLDQAKTWLMNCLKHHSLCNEECPTVYPNRLLALDGTKVKVVVTNNVSSGKALRYMTVSHRWSTTSMPKLLRSNLQEMENGIDSLTLPKVFQDVIVLAQALDIPFVWIDALCILQDEPGDLEHEIARMDHIYRNGFLNVGRLGDSGGLFTNRDPRAICGLHTRIERSDLKSDCFAYDGSVLSQVDSSPLAKRGWVLQERLLSQRSIYFGDQMFWECCSAMACETFPKNVTSTNLNVLRNPRRLSTIFDDTSIEKPFLMDTQQKYRTYDFIYTRWKEIIWQFTMCDLTIQQDYLPALSGLAHRFQTITKDRYLAGIWRKDMLHGLLWRRVSYYKGDFPIYPAEYRAPSWSWASINADIDVVEWIGHAERNLIVVCEILDAQTTPAGLDPMGRLKDGFLRISGQLYPSSRTLSKRHAYKADDWTMNDLRFQFEWFDDGYLESGDRPMLDTIFLPMACVKPGPPDAHPFKDPRGRIWGLMLEPVQGRLDTFRRIGAFGHVWNDTRPYQDEIPVSKNYPEFIGWEPEHVKLQTITIL